MVQKSLKELTQTYRETVEEIWVLSDGVQLPLLKLLLEQIPIKMRNGFTRTNPLSFQMDG